MGAGNSCESLTSASNGCNLANCTQSVTGLPSDSSSPSDIWLVTMNPTVQYEGLSIGGETLFLKIFPSPRQTAGGAFPMIKYRPLATAVLRSYQALDYEILVYRDLIRPLIDRGICQGFVKFMGSGNRCSYQKVLEILQNGKLRSPSSGQGVSDIEADIALKRNLAYILTEEPSRPSIDNTDLQLINKVTRRATTDLQVAVNDLSALFTYHGLNPELLTFNYVINEGIPDPVSFRKWKERAYEDYKLAYDSGKTQTEASYEIWSVVFQVFYSLYAMSLSHTVHNDMHLGNIWVLERPGGLQRVTYIIENEVFTFYSKHSIKIYDFDKAYNSRLGDNPSLEGHSCDHDSQCNEYIPNIDFIKFAGYLFECGDERPTLSISIVRQIILALISPDYGSAAQIHRTYKHSCFLQDQFNDRANPYLYSTLHDAHTILKNTGALIAVPPTTEDLNNLEGVCNRSFFNSVGKIMVSGSVKDTINLLNTPAFVTGLVPTSTIPSLSHLITKTRIVQAEKAALKSALHRAQAERITASLQTGLANTTRIDNLLDSFRNFKDTLKFEIDLADGIIRLGQVERGEALPIEILGQILDYRSIQAENLEIFDTLQKVNEQTAEGQRLLLFARNHSTIDVHTGLLRDETSAQQDLELAEQLLTTMVSVTTNTFKSVLNARVREIHLSQSPSASILSSQPAQVVKRAVIDEEEKSMALSAALNERHLEAKIGEILDIFHTASMTPLDDELYSPAEKNTLLHFRKSFTEAKALSEGEFVTYRWNIEQFKENINKTFAQSRTLAEQVFETGSPEKMLKIFLQSFGRGITNLEELGNELFQQMDLDLRLLKTRASENVETLLYAGVAIDSQIASRAKFLAEQTETFPNVELPQV